jgi:PmbA protein
MRDHIESTILALLAKAKQKGASAAEASASFSEGFNVNVRKGEVDTVEFNRDKGLTLTVYCGQRQGVVSSSDLSEQALNHCLDKAWTIAQYTDEDPAAGLAPKERMATKVIELDLYHPWQITPEEAIPLLKEAEAVAMASDSRISNSEGVNLNTHQSDYVYANSHGFCGTVRSTSHSFSCVLLATDKNGAMQRDYEYTHSRDAKTLDDFSTVAKRAAEYTVQRLGAQSISTGKMPIIFSQRMVSGLWGELLAAISGGNLYRDSSFLKGTVGKAILNKCVTLVEDPTIKRGWASSYFDREGVATQKRDLVKAGVLQGYILNSYSARRLGLETTGNAGGPHNILVHSTGEDEQTLLQKMNRGLLVTEVMGMGVNLVTGDYSQGASGFWVEQGKIQYPVEGVTIAGNLSDMFANIVAIGNDFNCRSYIQSGSVLVAEMMVAGKD